MAKKPAQKPAQKPAKKPAQKVVIKGGKKKVVTPSPKSKGGKAASGSTSTKTS